MTLEEARTAATLAMAEAWAGWIAEELGKLEAEGMAPDEAAQTFRAHYDERAGNAAVHRHIDELARVLLDHRAPRRLQ